MWTECHTNVYSAVGCRTITTSLVSLRDKQCTLGLPPVYLETLRLIPAVRVYGSKDPKRLCFVKSKGFIDLQFLQEDTLREEGGEQGPSS